MHYADRKQNMESTKAKIK